MTTPQPAPAPSPDDLLRAAAWLEEQADEADNTASVLSGERSFTAEASRTRQTAAWLRDQADR